MLKTLSALLATVGLLSACSYGHRAFVPTPGQEVAMHADSQRVQDEERAERAERRREYREVIMDEAEAHRRAHQGKKIYILH